jgi:hypothetical protein
VIISVVIIRWIDCMSVYQRRPVYVFFPVSFCGEVDSTGKNSAGPYSSLDEERKSGVADLNHNLSLWSDLTQIYLLSFSCSFLLGPADPGDVARMFHCVRCVFSLFYNKFTSICCIVHDHPLRWVVPSSLLFQLFVHILFLCHNSCDHVFS